MATVNSISYDFMIGASTSPFTYPSVPADMDTVSAGSNIRMFALNIGDTSLSDVAAICYNIAYAKAINFWRCCSRSSR
jgi:hypothetical protein